MKFSKENFIEEERHIECVEMLKVIVRCPEPVEGFFAPAEYSLRSVL